MFSRNDVGVHLTIYLTSTMNWLPKFQKSFTVVGYQFVPFYVMIVQQYDVVVLTTFNLHICRKCSNFPM